MMLQPAGSMSSMSKNSHQNARNCTIFKNFLAGRAHNPPSNSSLLAKRHVYPKSKTYLSRAPPLLRNPAYAPDVFMYMF